MGNKLAIIAVTKNALQKGIALASFIQADVYCTRKYDVDEERVNNLRRKFLGKMNSSANTYEFVHIEKSLKDYVGELFGTYDSLIFISAVGIAVRCIAPYIRSKTLDPGVVVMDEEFNFAISLLSGHLGGANDIVSRLYEITGVKPVITTATDIHGITSFDNIAKNNNCVIENIDKLKTISSSLLNGESVYLYCPFDLDGIPQNIIIDDFDLISTRENAVIISNSNFEEQEDILKIRPRNLFLGIGFKKGIKADVMLNYFKQFLCENHLSIYSFAGISTINLKKNDLEIKKFAKKFNLNVKFYDSKELKPHQELFSQSDFVKTVTGVPSVCEPCAYIESNFGKKVVSKTVFSGVTFAVFEKKMPKIVF